MTDDFSPIAEQGELAPPQGFFAMAKRKLELPNMTAGFELVLIGGDGRPLVDPDGRPLRAGRGAAADKRRLSSGEIRNGRAHSWVKVDTREHMLEHDAYLQEPSGSAGFVATIVVACAVTDAATVAARGIEGARGVVAGALDSATAEIATTLQPLGDGDRLQALNAARLAAERALQARLQRTADGEHAGWLSVRVESVSVAFDEVTRQLHSDLLGHSHEGHVSKAVAKQEELDIDHRIEMRARWREALSDYLTAPGTRAIEHVLDDPSAENIARVVDHLNATEAKQQEQVYEVLKELIKEKYVHDPSEVPKVMKAILKNVNWQLPALARSERSIESGGAKRGRGRGAGSKAGSGSSGRPRAEAPAREDTVEAESVYAEAVDADAVDVDSVEIDGEDADA
jgi:hypothetical protein